MPFLLYQPENVKKLSGDRSVVSFLFNKIFILLISLRGTSGMEISINQGLKYRLSG